MFTKRFLTSTATKITTLSNGLRVATENNPSIKTCTLGMWIDSGSRWESMPSTSPTAPNYQIPNGTAHFLEHMIFKGTHKRSQSQLEVEVENMGAHLNAYTSREQTAYFAHLFSKDLPWATALLGDILQNPLLDNNLIDCERSVILREQEEIERQMEEVIFDHLHSIAFQGSSLGLTILGTSKDISSNINRNSLKRYISSNYIPSRMVLCASGNVDHSLLVREAENIFFKNYSIPQSIKPIFEDAKFVGSELRLHDDTMELAHMVIAVEGPSWGSPDFFPLMIAQSIVGCWNRGLAGNGASLSSNLAQSCAKNSLALSFTSFMTSYRKTGLWGIYMVSDHLSGLDDLVYEVQQEWVRICLNLGEGEVERAKRQLKSSLLLSLDSTNAIAEDIGRQVLIYGGKRLSWKEIFDQIDSCTLETIKKAASEYLYDRDPAVVAMGPISTFPDYNRIRAATLWLRN